MLIGPAYGGVTPASTHDLVAWVKGLPARCETMRHWPGKVVLLAWALGIGLLGSMHVLADSYGSAQIAASADAFRDTFPADDRGRYALAAVLDLFFAAAYGVIGVGLSRVVTAARPALRRVADVGGLLVAMGAALDELENVVLLWNIYDYGSVGDSSINLMRSVGSVKWPVGVLGFLVVVGAIVVERTSRPALLWRTKQWVAYIGVPYVIYLGLIVATFGAAAVQQRAVFWILVPALAVCGACLNVSVERSRIGAVFLPTMDYGPSRLVLGGVQVALGVTLVLVSLGDRAGNVADAALFLGIALSIMSLGGLVSELRDNRRWPRARSPILLGVAGICLLVARTHEPDGQLVLWIAVGLLAGEIGTELASAGYARWAARPPGISGTAAWRYRPPVRPTLVAGAVLSVVGLGWLCAEGVSIPLALVLFVVLGLVVMMALVDGDALALVVVLALALVFATKPSVGTLPDGVEPVAGEPYILVLGDSYMSGEGADEYLEGTNEVVDSRAAGDPHTNECRQAPTAWPFVVATAVADGRSPAADGEDPFPSRVLFLACSGAVAEDITTEPVLRDGQPSAPAQLALYEQVASTFGPPELVIVGIGGNDAGFGDIVSTCIGPGSCAELADEFFRSRPGPGRSPSRGPEALADIGDDLDLAYTNIGKAVGEDVPIVATSYPLPIDAEASCWKVMLDGKERAFVRAFVGGLNEQVRLAAARKDVIYADLSTALVERGNELCSSLGGDSGLNFLAFASKAGSIRESLNPANWIHNSLHPNARGHEALADEALSWFEGSWPLPEPAQLSDRPFAHSIDERIDAIGARACSGTCTIGDRGWLKERAADLYELALFPLAVTTIGLAIFLAPIVRHGHEKQWSLWTVVKRLTERLISAVPTES